jgi:hypothetical protein
MKNMHEKTVGKSPVAEKKWREPFGFPPGANAVIRGMIAQRQMWQCT